MILYFFLKLNQEWFFKYNLVGMKIFKSFKIIFKMNNIYIVYVIKEIEYYNEDYLKFFK